MELPVNMILIVCWTFQKALSDLPQLLMTPTPKANLLIAEGRVCRRPRIFTARDSRNGFVDVDIRLRYRLCLSVAMKCQGLGIVSWDYCQLKSTTRSRLREMDFRIGFVESVVTFGDFRDGLRLQWPSLTQTTRNCFQSRLISQICFFLRTVFEDKAFKTAIACVILLVSCWRPIVS